MKLQNIFWFLHAPQDEREELLYARVYRRLLLFITLLAACALILTWFPFHDGSLSVTAGEVRGIIWMVLIGCVLVGWSGLAQDELSFEETNTPAKKKSPWLLLGLILVLLLNLVVLVRLFPHHFVVFSLTTLLLTYLLLVVSAWYATPKLLIFARVILVIFFPIIALVYGYLKMSSPGKRVASSIVIGGVLSVVATIVLGIAIFLTGRGLHFYVTTDRYAPALQQGEHVYVNRQHASLTPGTLAIAKADDKTYRVTKIISRNGDTVTIESQNGPQDVPISTIVGSIMKETQLEKRFKQVLFSVKTDTYGTE